MNADDLKSTMENIGSVERVLLHPFARSTSAHGFVTFLEAASVNLAVQRSYWRSIYPHMNVKSMLEEDDELQTEESIPFRIMTKLVREMVPVEAVRFILTSVYRLDWIKRMDEYVAILEEKRCMLNMAIGSASGTHERQFENGVVARFEGVHPATGGKVLKVCSTESCVMKPKLMPQ